jgi:uncharacterized phage infection (PIP) family protein YhgE
MDENEIAILKEENSTLKKVITILIEQNEALKAEIAVSKMANGANNVPLAFSQMTNGNCETNIAFRQMTNGNNKVHDSISQMTNGNNKAHDALSQMTNGNTNASEGISQMTNGNTEIPHILPSFLPIDIRNKSRLFVLLKKEVLGKVKNSSVWSAVSLLLHFHNKGAGDYTELRKLTGLSNFGLAKYLRSLKKRGLIERDGWQKFKLTPHAVDLLVKAKCEAGI